MTFCTQSSANSPGVPAPSRCLMCHLRHQPEGTSQTDSGCVKVTFCLPPLCLEVTDSNFLRKRENLEYTGSVSCPCSECVGGQLQMHLRDELPQTVPKGGGNNLSSLYPSSPYHIQLRLMLR